MDIITIIIILAVTDMAMAIIIIIIMDILMDTDISMGIMAHIKDMLRTMQIIMQTAPYPIQQVLRSKAVIWDLALCPFMFRRSQTVLKDRSSSMP